MRLTSAKLLLSVVLTALLASAAYSADCRLSTRGWDQMHLTSIYLIHDDGRKTALRVRVADDRVERAAGYQHICPEIIELSAILFRYKQPGNRSFHMFNVHAALDIGFFDADGRLDQVIHMQPQTPGDPSAETYAPSNSFQFALETRAGFFSDNGLEAGATTLTFQ